MHSLLSKTLLVALFSAGLAAGVTGFGYDSGEPLPNVTDYRIYDVTGLSTTEKRNSGELVHQGLNETAILNHSSTSEYRFSFTVENDGASEWLINSSDEMEHRNVDNAWNLQEAYYNITSDLFFGGDLTDGNLVWDTSNQGSLEVGEQLEAEYILDLPAEDAELSQEFFVNDSKSGAGSRDYHNLRINELGELNVTMYEPPNNTVYQVNRTFDFNVSVGCSGGSCGDISMTPRYNTSSGKVPIPETENEPFYITNQAQSSNCDNLSAGEECWKQFLVNATGEEGDRFDVDVNTTSSYDKIGEEISNESLIGLNSFILMGLNWSQTDFGYIDPGQRDQPAECNVYSNCSYNIVIENYSIGVDNLWVKGSDLISEQDPSYNIPIQNVSYSLNNDIDDENHLDEEYSHVASDLEPGTVLSSFYWLDVPFGIVTGQYSGQLTFKANNTG